MKAKCEGTVFHGGCNGCTQQKDRNEGALFCARECCFFSPDWDKPDRNNRPKTEAEIVKEAIAGGSYINPFDNGG